MKNLFTFLSALIITAGASAQTIFWTENFTNGCTSLCTSYSGPNGAWTFVSQGPSSACGGPTTPNIWRISCAENGNAVGSCQTSCSSSNATLHVGNDPNSPSAGFFCPSGDCGSKYDAGGYCGLIGLDPSTITDILAQSPTINCTGRSSITVRFKYIEGGDGSNDNATLQYYNGSSWSQLKDMNKTSGCGGGQWTLDSVALPASANNNPNVRIAFRWVNDDDGNGNDPSFAVDDVELIVPAGGLPPVASISTAGSDSSCAPLCNQYTDNSTGNPTSWLWTFTGPQPFTTTAQNPGVLCWDSAGTYNVRLIVSNANGSDTAYKNNLKVTAAPATPFITRSNDTLYCSTDPSYISYQWYDNGTPIVGQTNTWYVFNHAGNFGCGVKNTAGCEVAAGITVGISTYSLNNTVSLFPNPAKNELTITGNWEATTGLLSIYDILGNKVREESVKLTSRFIYDIKSLSAGVYFLQVNNEKGRWTAKFEKY